MQVTNGGQVHAGRLNDVWQKIQAHWLVSVIVFLSSLGGCIALFMTVGNGITGLRSKVWPHVHQPKVALIGPMSGDLHVVWSSIFDGVSRAQQRWEPSLIIDNTFDDRGDPAVANEKARNICNDDSIDVAIGLALTKEAQEALKAFSQCKMPVIIVAATGTELTAGNDKEWNDNVLRLVPSNHEQAMHFADAIRDTFWRKPCKYVVLKDPGEPYTGYVDNLTKNFSSIMKEWRQIHALNCVEKQEPPDFIDSNIFKQRGIDVVLVFGMTSFAAETLKGRSQSPADKGPIVLISDGAMDSSLIDKAGTKSIGVWGAFPFGSPSDGFKDDMPGSELDKPTYFAYGYDSIVVLNKVLEDIKGAGKEVTRAMIGEYFKKLAQEAEPVKGMNGTYEFGRDGGVRFIRKYATVSSEDSGYHFWCLTGKNGLPPHWTHRAYRDPLSSRCPE